MCHYTDVIVGGDALGIQLLTAVAIAASIASWVYAYRLAKVDLRQYAVPITIWVLFGTLDILITARGTLGNPEREGNPLARYVFAETGWIGPVVASVLWISLWAGTVLAVNRLLKPPLAQFISLSVFYSLAIGHIFGFSSWFVPMCSISTVYRATLGFIPRFLKIIALGICVSALHLFVAERVTRFFKGR